jgi:hypothetical protein
MVSKVKRAHRGIVLYSSTVSSPRTELESVAAWTETISRAVVQRLPDLFEGTANERSFGHWEYTHYYYAQALYMLGDDGFARMFPDSRPRERLTWSQYREVIFDYLAARQNTDGSWSQGHIGPLFSTACHLAILQLDKGTLPIYQR